MRTILAYLISPALMLSGFKFSKAYRHGATLKHRAVYRLVDVVKANHLGG